MNRRQQSNHKISVSSQNSPKVRLSVTRKTYSKAIHPQKIQIKPNSLKNLDLATPQNFFVSEEGPLENDKSCCCSDCGRATKKVKHLKKKFLPFQSQMLVLTRKRLRVRFQNAVICIKYLVSKWKKIRQQERARRMFRYKTKIFDNNSPLYPSNSQHYQYGYLGQLSDGKQNQNPNTQSIQAQMLNQRHTQRQSVKQYLQQKLSKQRDSQQFLPQLTYLKQHTYSINPAILQPIRSLKTLPDEPNQSSGTKTIKDQQQSVLVSPYVKETNYMTKSARMIKNFGSESLINLGKTAKLSRKGTMNLVRQLA